VGRGGRRTKIGFRRGKGSEAERERLANSILARGGGERGKKRRSARKVQKYRVKTRGKERIAAVFIMGKIRVLEEKKRGNLHETARVFSRKIGHL